MNRTFLTLPLALVASALFLSLSGAPAVADEAFCTAMPAKIRTVAASATDATAAKAAVRDAATGVKLCDAGNDRAARKKFEVAFKRLGVAEADYAELAK
jgi:hypothetical protein